MARWLLYSALLAGAFAGGRASCFLTHRPEPKCIDAIYAERLRIESARLEQKLLDHEQQLHALALTAVEQRVVCERGY